MASILIKNIPPTLHARLKERAKSNHRSLNRETIAMLEETMAEDDSPPASSAPEEATPPSLSPEIAARLRALRYLGDSLASREVDFEAWQRDIQNARR